jgi:hypothetical protein
VEALGAVGLLLLVANVVAHVAVVVAIGRVNVLRGVAALLLPPLGIAWGWELGARRRVIAQGAAIGVFAIVVVVIRLTR